MLEKFAIWIFLVTITFVIYIISIFERKWKDLHPLFRKAISTISVAILSLAILSPFYYEFPGNYHASEVATINKNGDITYHPFGTFCIEFSGHCFNIPVAGKPVSISISPLTANPKVRPIKYRMDVSITNPELFYEKFPEAKFSDGSNSDLVHAETIMKKRTKYWLLEFNEANSREISKFYNYLNEKQQEEFGKMVESWVNPKLEQDGIAIQFDGFWLTDL